MIPSQCKQTVTKQDLWKHLETKFIMSVVRGHFEDSQTLQAKLKKIYHPSDLGSPMLTKVFMSNCETDCSDAKETSAKQGGCVDFDLNCPQLDSAEKLGRQKQQRQQPKAPAPAASTAHN